MYSLMQGAFDPAVAVLTAALLIGFAGIPGLLLRRWGAGQLCAVAITLPAAALGVIASLQLIHAGTTAVYILPWSLPFGSCEFVIDPLSAFFMLPVFIVSSAGSIFSVGYWPSADNRATEPGLTFFYGVLASSMALLLMSRNGVFFIMAWESMALSAYFLLMTEDRLPEVRRAGSIYLIASHSGTLALLVYFSLLAAETGSFVFPPAGTLSGSSPAIACMAVFALIGFGAKAGIMPLHIWLPSAHANAPSHVSALMSGVMLKMGLYGILRSLTFVQEPPLLWGWVLTGGGVTTAFLGIAFAMSQRDVKRLLACSSIENIGIITTGLGISMLGGASGNPVLYFLGMAGALLHILNHSFFKPLLFLGGGIIIHATGTRDINLMGGLGKAMPRLSPLFLVGSIAICGIPPLNGFVSEFFLYLGLFSDIETGGITNVVLVAPLLGLVGGLAVITFIKLYVAIFLGTPRSTNLPEADEAGYAMLLPVALLAFLCMLVGVLPQLALRMVSPVVAICCPGLPVNEFASQYFAITEKLSLLALLLIAAVAICTIFWKWRADKTSVSSAPTWGCGYLRSTSRMQYGGTALSELPVLLFSFFVRQRVIRPLLSGYFPGKTACSDHSTETLLDRVILPLFALAGSSFTFLRHIQHGLLHAYMLYIFATLLILMLWAS